MKTILGGIINGEKRRDAVDEEYDNTSCCFDTGFAGTIRQSAAMIKWLNPAHA